MTAQEKEQQDRQFVLLAQTIGKLTDEVIKEEHDWHGNTYQKWVVQHPMALNILRVVLRNEELTAEVKKQLDEFDDGVVYRIEKKVQMPTEEEHQELIDTLQNGLEIFSSFTKIIDEDMSDPELMSKGMIVRSLRDILSKLRASNLTEVSFACPKCLNQENHCHIGKPVAVRPCDAEYEGKTFLGIYLGEFPAVSGWSINRDEPQKMIVTPCLNNPAIFVPSLRKTIFGYESWWREIKNPEKIDQITDTDIDSAWYVQLAKSLCDPKN